MNAEINWYGDDRFEWKYYKKFENKFKIEDIKIIELKNEISNVSGNPGFKSNWWSLGGLQFLDGLNQISIYNGFNTNYVTQDILVETGIRTKEIPNIRVR